ncbi:MAG: TylF/MycF/NovP-related O-methyltransferase [Bacteroidales bacterium]|nr:TylF/MycF/NovP-related O-methyltransferase [Bacteroidales bacterium]
MNLTLFQIANYTLIILLLVLFIRYLWIVFVIHDDDPEQWRHAVKSKQIPAKIKWIKRRYADKVRFFNWWFQIERLKREHVPGVLVELGVYKGDSAQVIHHLDPERQLHLFDTFAGFTASDLLMENGEAATYTTKNFADTSVQTVLRKIDGNYNIIIHQGHFPESARGFHETVALVNMDADLYNPTKAGLEFFYPLLSPGGVIMVHDYNYKWPGIIKAVDDFVKTIPEKPVLLPDINGTVVLIKNSPIPL